METNWKVVALVVSILVASPVQMHFLDKHPLSVDVVLLVEVGKIELLNQHSARQLHVAVVLLLSH